MRTEQPILFDTESVRGMLTCAQCGQMSVLFPCEHCGSEQFSKTQTRRVVRRLRMHEDFGKPVWDEAWIDHSYDRHGSCCLKVPYRGGIDETVQRHWPAYVKGETGWVREPLKRIYQEVAYSTDSEFVKPMLVWRWKKDHLPSMFMPKVALRLWVQFKTPGAQRLQEISEEDAVAEGVFGPPWSQAGWRSYPYETCNLSTASESFMTRIMAINGPKVWDENWWVWRYSFHRIASPDGE